MTLSVPGDPVSCEKFPHCSQMNFWSPESIFNQFSVFLKTMNALCVCLQYKHPRSIKRVIRSDKPVTLLLLLWSLVAQMRLRRWAYESHNCDFGSDRVKQTAWLPVYHTNSIFTCVFSLVNNEQGFPGVGLRTLVADVRFLTSVGAGVHHKVRLMWEPGIAELALVRPLSCSPKKYLIN
jgi:hypothetical protein